MRIIGVELRYQANGGRQVELTTEALNILLRPCNPGGFNATIHTDVGDFNLIPQNTYDTRFELSSQEWDVRI